MAPPAVEGMSNTGGFEGFVQSRTNDYAALEQATQKLVAAAAQRPELAGVGTSYSAQVPRVHVDIDVEKAKLLAREPGRREHRRCRARSARST